MKTLACFLLALTCAGASAAPKYLILNEDNDHFFKYPASYMDEAHLRAYVAQLAEGGKVTHIHFCPTGGRASFDSKTWEPIWRGLEEYPKEQTWFLFYRWATNAKALFDKGIDPYAVWIDECRKRGVSPWLAPRMNDMHDAAASLTKFYRSTTFWRTRKDLRIYPDYDKTSWSHHQFNYAYQEVRDDAYRMIEELFERYDMDGLSICGNIWFPKETARESTPVLSDFMRKVRRLADAWEKKRGHRIGLCAQVWGGPEDNRRNGFDVAALAREGVFDWIIVDTWQNGLNVPVDNWRAELDGRDVKIIGGAHESFSGAGKAPYYAYEAAMYRGWADALALNGVDGYHFWNLQYYPREQADVCREGLDPRDTKDTLRSYMSTLNGLLPRKLDREQTIVTRVGANANGSPQLVLGFREKAPLDLEVTLNGAKAVWNREEYVQKYFFQENHSGREFEPRLGLQGRRLVFPEGCVRTGDNTVVIRPTAGQEDLDYYELQLVPSAKNASAASARGAAFVNHVHRGGGAKTRPDNTLETFVWAWEHGAGVECDCRLTKDGVPVMLHDETLRRTGRNAAPELLTNKVSTLAYAQIRDVDVGSYLDARYAGQRVPTLAQVLAELGKDPRRTLFVDEKGIGPKRLAEAAKAAGVLGQVWYTTCSPEQIADWHRLTGGAGKSRLWWGPGTREHTPEALARGESRFEALMRKVRAKKYEGVTLVCFDVHYNPKFADPFVPSSDYIRRLAKEFAQAKVIFTCIPYEGGDDPECYRRLKALGVEGFGTDDPETLFEVMK